MTDTATQEGTETSMALYELMLILNPDLLESDLRKKLKEVTDLVTKADGKIVQEDFWGKRKLAYRIGKYQEGAYMIYNFLLPLASLKELQHLLRVEKEIIRSMLLRLPTDYVYTKYDFDAAPTESLRKEKKMERRPPKPFKKFSDSPTPVPVVRETTGPVTSVTAPTAVSETVSPEKAALNLDKKLDEILGGEDINL